MSPRLVAHETLSIDEQESVELYAAAMRRFQAACASDERLVLGVRVPCGNSWMWKHTRGWPIGEQGGLPSSGSAFAMWDYREQRVVPANVYRVLREPNPNEDDKPFLRVIVLMPTEIIPRP